MATVFVDRSLRAFLLEPARMFLVAAQVDICRQLFSDFGKLLGIHGTKDQPILTGDGDHHAVIRLRDF